MSNRCRVDLQCFTAVIQLKMSAVLYTIGPDCCLRFISALRAQICHIHVTGVQSGGCGEMSIRLRPALIFQEKHAHVFLDIFRQVLRETK